MSDAAPIVVDGQIVGVICLGPAMVETVRRPDGEPRWCFRCRKVRSFVFSVMAPTVPSYYGPNPSVRCDVCNLDDGDCFPGRNRIWDG